MRIEKDLRNSIRLPEHPFQGKSGEMSFPVLEMETRTEHLKVPHLLRVRYFLENDRLIRAQQEISDQLVPQKPARRTALKQAAKVKFSYSYLNEGKSVFLPYWMEEPYAGIPRAIKIQMEPERLGHSLVQLISIPQGKFGRLAENESEKDSVDE